MPRPKNNLFFGLGPKLTNEQKIYLDSIFDHQLTIVNAASGTGKSTLAVGAAKLLNKPLYYIFSPVEEQTMGFTPGSVEEKEQKYIQPLLDALLEINEEPSQVVYKEENIEAIKQGKVWVYPKSHVFTRGINIKDATVIIDEAQNFTKSELKKVLTRIHDSCKVIVIGHEGQIDLENPRDSGFKRVLEHFETEDYAKICKLTTNFRGKLAQRADLL